MCQGDNSVYYYVDPIANATGYAWSVPEGADIVSGNNTNSIEVNFSEGAFSGNISVYGTSASCGNGAVSPAFAVSVSAPPTAAAAGSDMNLACGETSATLSANMPTSGTGMWSVVNGTATVTNPTSPTSTVTGLALPGRSPCDYYIQLPLLFLCG